ncbi:hypothetical protein BJY52DRAFT_1253153 [Lactarius psammicola]|nr:hypothetical protein BJY52DRAFT_1253153 [Lactarius psammicola]
MTPVLSSLSLTLGLRAGPWVYRQRARAVGDRSIWHPAKRHHCGWRDLRLCGKLDADLATQPLHSLIFAHVPHSCLSIQVSCDSYTVVQKYIVRSSE